MAMHTVEIVIKGLNNEVSQPQSVWQVHPWTAVSTVLCITIQSCRGDGAIQHTYGFQTGLIRWESADRNEGPTELINNKSYSSEFQLKLRSVRKGNEKIGEEGVVAIDWDGAVIMSNINRCIPYCNSRLLSTRTNVPYKGVLENTKWYICM